jgi:hypothetical protein
VSKAGIGHSMLDNLIIPSLIKDNLIKRDANVFGMYSLVEDKPTTGSSLQDSDKL